MQSDPIRLSFRYIYIIYLTEFPRFNLIVAFRNLWNIFSRLGNCLSELTVRFRVDYVSRLQQQRYLLLVIVSVARYCQYRCRNPLLVETLFQQRVSSLLITKLLGLASLPLPSPRSNRVTDTRHSFPVTLRVGAGTRDNMRTLETNYQCTTGIPT